MPRLLACRFTSRSQHSLKILLIPSNILRLLRKMSQTFQSNNLNLFSIEGHVRDYTAALSRLKEDPFSGGYFFTLHTIFASLGISVALTEADFLPKIKRYIEQLVVNQGNHFPHCRALTLLGYLNLRNYEPSNTSCNNGVGRVFQHKRLSTEHICIGDKQMEAGSTSGSMQEGPCRSIAKWTWILWQAHDHRHPPGCNRSCVG